MNSFFTADLRLVKAKERLDPVAPGQPLIMQYWSDRAVVFEEPTIFLNERYCTLSATPSKHTWEAVGYDLLSWLQWCQLRKIDWRDASENDRRQFADDYVVASRDDKSINRKLTVVRRFYAFAQDEGWYHRDIGAAIDMQQIANRPIDDDALAHIRSTAGPFVQKDTLLRRVGRKDVVKPLLVKHLHKLIAHVGPTQWEAGDERSVRDRLICDLGWMSGVRLGDVTSLTTLQLLALTVEPHEQFTEFPLIVQGKMKATRMVAVPGWLVLAIQAYITRERAESEREGKRRGVRMTTSLFVGHAKSKSAGKPITRSAVQKMFALACVQCGITEQIEVEDFETGKKYVKTVPAHSFHDLRHNCAVLTYHAEKAQGNPEPWKIVQIKLGHKSLKVTIDTYLAHVSIFGEQQGVTDIRRLLGLRT